MLVAAAFMINTLRVNCNYHYYQINILSVYGTSTFCQLECVTILVQIDGV